MKTSQLFMVIVALAMVGLGGCAKVVLAQEVRGAISGRITDPTGAALPGARVHLVHVETNVALTTLTNDEGLYAANFLLPGLYAVTAEARGYKKLVRGGVQVRVEDKLELNLAMEVGGVNETVNVTSQAPLLETNTASLGQVMESRLISELPCITPASCASRSVSRKATPSPSPTPSRRRSNKSRCSIRPMKSTSGV